MKESPLVCQPPSTMDPKASIRELWLISMIQSTKVSEIAIEDEPISPSKGPPTKTSKKLLTVFGATSSQGSSIINTVLADPALSSKYSIRAVLYDTSKPSARDLASRGCQVVAAEPTDPASVAEAIEGAYGVFATTSWSDTRSRTIEFAQGRAITNTCIAAGVKHLVWSSTPDITKKNGKRFDKLQQYLGKLDAEEYMERLKQRSGMWTTYFVPSHFMVNFPHCIQADKDGTSTFIAPFSKDVKIPLTDTRNDTGKYVLGAFEAGAEANGKRLQAVSQWTSAAEIAEVFTKHNDVALSFSQVPQDTFKERVVKRCENELLAEELLQSMDLVSEYHVYGDGWEEKQKESDGFLLKDTKLTSLEEYVERGKPWRFDEVEKQTIEPQ